MNAPKENSHAKNRHYRRIQNFRYGKLSAYRGEPIPGELTQKEIAHKQRRWDRRVLRHTGVVYSFSEKFAVLQSELKILENSLSSGMNEHQKAGWNMKRMQINREMNTLKNEYAKAASFLTQGKVIV